MRKPLCRNQLLKRANFTSGVVINGREDRLRIGDQSPRLCFVPLMHCFLSLANRFLALHHSDSRGHECADRQHREACYRCASQPSEPALFTQILACEFIFRLAVYGRRQVSRLLAE